MGIIINISALLVGLATLIITAVMLIYMRRDQESKKVKRFSGEIGTDCPDTPAFISFLEENIGKVVHVDVNLFDDQTPSIDKDNFFCFTIYPNSSNKLVGGTSIRIKVIDDDSFYYDGRLQSKRLHCNLKVLGVAGPNQGIMTILMKSISIENVSRNDG